MCTRKLKLATLSVAKPLLQSRRVNALLGVWPLVVGLLLLVGCGSEAKVPDAAQRLIEAKEAIARGDNAAALVSLQASIDSEPNVWAYLERAKLNAKQGADQAVEEDCVAILKLHPENRDVPWLRAELKKPAANRFQGAAAESPGAKK